MRWVEKYIGLPFVDGGRDMNGVDCWGLYWLILRNEAGLELARYDTIPATALTRIARTIGGAASSGPWSRVDAPRRFDLVRMNGYTASPTGEGQKHALHIGCMADEGHVLHVERGTDSVLVPVGHFSVRPRLAGFYRPEGLNA